MNSLVKRFSVIARSLFYYERRKILMEKIYHITERTSLAKIFSEGLKPQIGTRSKKAHEKKPLICITDEIDLPQWILIFTKRRLIRNVAVLEINKEFLKHRTVAWKCNANEEEGALFEEIPPQYLKEIPVPKITRKQLWNFYFTCLHDLAYLCYDLLNYFYNPDIFNGYPNFYNGAIKDAKNIINSLDSAAQYFSPDSPSRKKIHNELIHYWKEYSLFNNYKILICKNFKGERYYSALDLFEDKSIVQLRDWVKTNLDLELLEKSIAL